MDPDLGELHETLRRLHAELASVAPRVDPRSRKLLRAVLGDIERVLKEPPPAEPGVTPRLEALAIDFEADHPGLAGTIRQLVDLLGRAGI